MAVILDTTFGNMTPAMADRMRDAADIWIDDHAPGCTEPWIVEILCALLKATGVAEPVVFESGGFRGTTSEWLARAIKRMGGGKLIVAELDDSRAELIHQRLRNLPLDGVSYKVMGQDAQAVIRGFSDGYVDFAFLDDEHTAQHVAEEVELLLPKMRSKGIMAFHDVYGVCELHRVVRAYGGYCLDLPRLGPAGGIGIVQVP